MDSLQIKYFKIVAKTLNISQAAKVLYISQSSLSQTIKHLENELGYPLFDRNKQRIALNKNGILFLDFIKKMEQEYEAILTQMAENTSQNNQKVSIQVLCASLYLPKIMEYLKEKLPNTSFMVYQWNHDIQSDIDADIQLYATSTPVNSNNCSLLLEEDILLALPQSHSLLNKSEIVLSDLKNEKFISLNSSWSLEKVITEKCNTYDFYPKTSIQVDNPDILRHLLCQNLGLAFIPEKTWGIDFANGILKLCPIKDFSMKRYVYLRWKTEYSSQSAIKCISLIKDFFQENFIT